MTKTQACAPCAKRKVRCDQIEPKCSNCKRRKQDRCVYPETDPYQRIKRLESQIQELSALKKQVSTPAASDDVEDNPSYPQDVATNHGQGDPVILEEHGQTFYLESRSWQGWLGMGMNLQNPFKAKDLPDAMQGILRGQDSVDRSISWLSQQDALTLWRTFAHRVQPLVRISFDWNLKRLSDRFVAAHLTLQIFGTSQPTDTLSESELALVYSIYLVSVVSLSEEECSMLLHQSKSFVLFQLQLLCEDALYKTNIFCITDIKVLQALAHYMISGVERLSLQSLWSLMGLVIRNAEKIGIHRDGALLGLSPAVAQERARLWWQLQHLDLILAIMSGLTPLTLQAEWDAPLPLNIEDEDIEVETREPPQERKGLTSMSYNMYCYWVLKGQRSYFQKRKGHFELSWQTNTAIPQTEKVNLFDHLEEGQNTKFLQYCDLIKPTDTLLQIVARSLSAGFRLRGSHPLVYNGTSGTPMGPHRDELLQTSIKCLEYNIALHTQSHIKHFLWWTQNMFPWLAFMCVVIEAAQTNKESTTERIWDLLIELYTVNMPLWHLADDHRRPHAAGMIIHAWKLREEKHTGQLLLLKPQFLEQLESKLSAYQARHPSIVNANPSQHRADATKFEYRTDGQYPNEQDFNIPWDLDFQDIDWSFWTSVV